MGDRDERAVDVGRLGEQDRAGAAGAAGAPASGRSLGQIGQELAVLENRVAVLRRRRDQLLVAGWEAGRSMSDLAVEAGLSVMTVSRRLAALGATGPRPAGD